MILQFCGLSGAGKTTLALKVKKKLLDYGAAVEIIDGDEYRKSLCSDLGFSKEDRLENIRRLGFVAGKLSDHEVISIISAINPYRQARCELKKTYKNVKTIFIDCPVPVLRGRDTKGMYKRSELADGDPDKIMNLTGINDKFEAPTKPDLYINTAITTVEECAEELFSFIVRNSPFLFSSARFRRSKNVSYDFSQNS